MNKIKSIIFDLDGVLVDTKNIHFEALNKSLKDVKTGYQISYKDHVRIFDGLPTLEKLKILEKKIFIKKILKKLFSIKIIIQTKKFLRLNLIKKYLKFSKNFQKNIKLELLQMQ